MSAIQRQPYVPKRATPIGFYKESGITRPIMPSVQRTQYVPTHQYGKIISKFTHDLGEFGKLKSQHLAKKLAIQQSKARYTKIDRDLDMFVKLGLIEAKQYNQLKNELRHEYETFPLGKFPSQDLRKKMTSVAQLANAEYQKRLREQKWKDLEIQEKVKEEKRLENLMKPERSENDPYIPFSKKTKDFEDEIVGHDYSKKENIHASGRRTPIEEKSEEKPEEDSKDFEEKLAVISSRSI